MCGRVRGRERARGLRREESVAKLFPTPPEPRQRGRAPGTAPGDQPVPVATSRVPDARRAAPRGRRGLSARRTPSPGRGGTELGDSDLFLVFFPQKIHLLFVARVGRFAVLRVWFPGAPWRGRGLLESARAGLQRSPTSTQRSTAGAEVKPQPRFSSFFFFFHLSALISLSMCACSVKRAGGAGAGQTARAWLQRPTRRLGGPAVGSVLRREPQSAPPRG